jgi:hypothetical protein
VMHGREKSDSAIVAAKPTNKAVRTAAEPVERRAGAKGNASQQSTHRTQRRVRVSQAPERVRQVSPSHTQGGSRVREFRSHGSGGAVSNGRPYRTSMRVLRILTRSGFLERIHSTCLSPLSHRLGDGDVVSCLHCMNDPQPDDSRRARSRRRCR